MPPAGIFYAIRAENANSRRPLFTGILKLARASPKLSGDPICLQRLLIAPGQSKDRIDAAALIAQTFM